MVHEQCYKPVAIAQSGHAPLSYKVWKALATPLSGESVLHMFVYSLVFDGRWLWLALLFRTDMDMSLHIARHRWHTRVTWAKVMRALHGADAQVGGDGGGG